MNIYKKLYEGISDTVYHYTKDFEGISKTNSLYASLIYGFEDNKNYKYYISTARSLMSSYIWEGVVLELDGRRLSNSYKAIPHDFYQESNILKGKEFEDRILLNKPVINNINKYIKRIFYIYNDNSNLLHTSFIVQYKQIKEYSEKHNIEFVFLNSKNKYKKIDIEKFIKSKEIIEPIKDKPEYIEYKIKHLEDKINFKDENTRYLMTCIHLLEFGWIQNSDENLSREGGKRYLFQDIHYNKYKNDPIDRVMFFWLYDISKKNYNIKNVKQISELLKKLSIHEYEYDHINNSFTTRSNVIRDEEMRFDSLILDAPDYVLKVIEVIKDTINDFKMLLTEMNGE